MKLAALWLALGAAALLLAPGVRCQEQSAPAAAHAKKKKRAPKAYDYDQSQYKAYRALTGQTHYRFDKDGNPVDTAAPKKVASKGKGKKRKAPAATSAPAAPAEMAHAHFGSSVGSAEAPPASAAPRSEGAGSAPVAGGSCQGDTCSQPPAGQ